MGSQATRDETQLLIGGRWTDAGDGTYDIINPATEQVVGQAPNASVDDANAAAAAGTNITPDSFSIVNQPGTNVWPLATYSWAIVAKNQTNEAAGEAAVKYLDWETHYAQGALAKAEGYVPLPAAIAAYSRQQLANVTSGGVELLTKTT